MNTIDIIRMIANSDIDTDRDRFIFIAALDGRPAGQIAFSISREDAIAARCLMAVLTDPKLEAMPCENIRGTAMTFFFLATEAGYKNEPFGLGQFVFYDRNHSNTLAMQHITRVIADLDVDPGLWPTVAYRIAWLYDFACRFQTGMAMLAQTKKAIDPSGSPASVGPFCMN